MPDALTEARNWLAGATAVAEVLAHYEGVQHLNNASASAEKRLANLRAQEDEVTKAQAKAGEDQRKAIEKEMADKRAEADKYSADQTKKADAALARAQADVDRLNHRSTMIEETIGKQTKKLQDLVDDVQREISNLSRVNAQVTEAETKLQEARKALEKLRGTLAA